MRMRPMCSTWSHLYADTYAHDGASLLYARATRTSLLRAVRTEGSGQLATGAPRAVLCVRRTRSSIRQRQTETDR